MHPFRPAVVIALLVIAAWAPAARAAGPPLLGGEDKVHYTGTPKGGGEFRLEMDAGTDTITYLWLDAKRITRCGPPGRRVWREQTGLVNRPFHVGRDRHVVKRLRNTIYPGDLESWDLRFDRTWSTVTLHYLTHYRHNYLKRCSGKATIVARHQPPKTWWQLGTYAGTTGQGLPITFTAAAHSTRAGAWTYTDFLARDLKATVTFTCDDGFTTTRELALDLSQEAGDATGSSAVQSALSATLTPGGVARDRLSGAEQVYAELSGALAGAQATGTIRPQGEHVTADGGSASCSGDPVSFTAARTG
ncbi:hypothetical protein FSW04_18870 [Baekduia soli]|uniref:Uncharacterized protein n=1 Tax=Baekduia soli TaxID=496014 RepID=A0A5B8U8H6_9ACTN|nr:hypothetical protein [Baekduia soli]QEC49429.1 hypothetical protein FSW04_18870 [Baekduia soli]